MPELAKLAGAFSGVPGVDADKEAYLLLVPSVGRFSPPVKDLDHPVEEFLPEMKAVGSESLPAWVLIGSPVSFAITGLQGGVTTTIPEHMFYVKG